MMASSGLRAPCGPLDCRPLRSHVAPTRVRQRVAPAVLAARQLRPRYSVSSAAPSPAPTLTQLVLKFHVVVPDVASTETTGWGVCVPHSRPAGPAGATSARLTRPGIDWGHRGRHGSGKIIITNRMKMANVAPPENPKTPKPTVQP